MEKLTQEERFVLYVMKTRRSNKIWHYSLYMQSINKIAKDTMMDKEELRETLMSLEKKGYLETRKSKRDGAFKWMVKRM